jgi:hypothetical protein
VYPLIGFLAPERHLWAGLSQILPARAALYVCLAVIWADLRFSGSLMLPESILTFEFFFAKE